MKWAALLVLAACRPAATPHASAHEVVRTAAVARGQILDRVLLTGEVHAASSIDLSVPRTEYWALAIRWLAEDGAMVKAGDRVLEFDNSQFTQQLDQKKLALREADAALVAARDLQAITTETKQVELKTHRIELEKATVRADVPPDLLSGRDAQERQLEKKKAQVAVDKAEQDLIAQEQEADLELKVKQIEADKAKRAIDAAEKSIAELVVHAPRDGMLVVETHPWEGRKYQVGDTVQPGMTIVSLPDLDKGMEAHADLSDVDDGRVAVGDTGTCTLDAYPDTPIACKVEQLTPVARPKGGRGSLRRAFSVVLSLASATGERMRPGMSVKVELRRAPLSNVLVVPRGAVVLDGKTARVRMASGELRDVDLGPCDAQACAVDKGLAEGEQVRLE
jgi:multidrug efflux pump subunit AcrA (membrane-fusion protein)